MAPDPWELIKQGKFDQAIAEYSRALQFTPRDTALLNNRGTAYLGLQAYKQAAADFGVVMGLSPDSDGACIKLGVCYWCMFQPTQAVASWKQGLGRMYTDAAGGVENPATLLYASLRLGDKVLQREATSLLRQHSRSRHLVNWPGAIVPFLLGKITSEAMQAAAYRPTTPASLAERFRCQASFYAGTRRLLEGDAVGFERGMRECSASWNGFLEQEYYLARWEVENDFPQIRQNDS